MRKEGIITGVVPHWSNSYYGQHGSHKRTALLLLPFKPSSLFLLSVSPYNCTMVKTNPRWLCHVLLAGKRQNLPFSTSIEIPFPFCPHHTYLSFMNCYKVISCKCWTRPSKKLTWFTSFSNAWKHVPTGNEIKTFKLLANREFVKNSFLD